MAIDTGLENELTNCHLGLVVSQARKYFATPVTDIDDYIQAGSIALLKAIRLYNPSKNVKFGTYAWKAINNAILKEMHRFNKYKSYNLKNLVNIESEQQSIWDLIPDSLSKLEELAIELRLQNKTLKEIGQELGYSKEWVNQILSSAITKIRKANENI